MRKKILKRLLHIIIIGTLFLSGCISNPVTGRQELGLVSESEEIQVGRQQYGPGKQMSGGEFITDPEVAQYVNSVGQKLSAVSDRKLPYEFTVLNNSTPNAWTLPGGKMALNRGLLTELKNESELAAVLSHEMVHAAARHGAKAMERGLLLQGAIMATGIALSDSKYANLGIVGAQLSAVLLNQKYSRDAEREADLYGMQYMSKAGYDPLAAVTLQETFVRLSEEKRQNWLSGLFSSHPPSRERVEANRTKASQLPKGGTLGAEQFRKMTARLQQTKSAYKAYDDGQKALEEQKPDLALSLAEKAIKSEPREALFYSLKGDAKFKQKNYPDAVANYDRAISLNPGFFQFYIQRGLARKKINDSTGAKADLEKSISLLPTATAHKALGDLALASGDRQNAISHYSAASDSGSEAGKQARGALVRLDMPNNPGRYLQTRIGLSRDGFAFAKIINSTSVPVQNLKLAIRFRDSYGRIQELTRTIPQTIYPGESAQLPLGLGQISNPAALNNVSATVVYAEVVE